MDRRKFYVNIDAGITWYNDKIATKKSKLEKVNRTMLGRAVFGKDSVKEYNASKMSKWKSKEQIPNLEQWLIILDFFTPPNLSVAKAWQIKQEIQEILICYYD